MGTILGLYWRITMIASVPMKGIYRWLLVGTVLGVAPAAGQGPVCSFDQCALRRDASFWGARLVAGHAATTVARLGFFPARVSVLEEASDSSRYWYHEYRRAQSTGAWLSLAGVGLMMGAGLAHRDHHDDALTAGLFLGGAGLVVGGGISLRRGGNNLERSVWWYNRGLPPNP
jgi:hypothetical protein